MNACIERRPRAVVVGAPAVAWIRTQEAGVMISKDIGNAVRLRPKSIADPAFQGEDRPIVDHSRRELTEGRVTEEKALASHHLTAVQKCMPAFSIHGLSVISKR
jgi:hypothetical protein